MADRRLATGMLVALLVMALGAIESRSAIWVAPSDAASPAAVPDAALTAHLRVVEDAIGRRDISTAVRAWHDLWGAALGSRRWEPMITAGDAFVAIGRAAGTPNGAKPNARQAYLTALFRARRDGAVDGVLRSAAAFAALEDWEVASQCLRIADDLARASGDPAARAQVTRAADALKRQRS